VSEEAQRSARQLANKRIWQILWPM